MKSNDLTHFEKLLLTEKNAVINCLQHQAEEIDETTDEVLNPLAESETNLLEKIELALSKIENGTYGICVTCGEQIPRDRLEAKPAVSLCCDCQKKHESAA